MPQLEFRISSGLKNIIGRDLITDDFIAVFELVKNSFDAHAKTVDIIFEDNAIIIKDNGKGMSLEDIQDKWLFVAYSAKSTGEEDENLSDKYRDKIQAKRYYAGAKGIGRFSCDRLGKRLKLVSRQPNAQRLEEINVRWEDFEIDPKKEFIDIKVDHQSISPTKYPALKQGTILEIEGLHDTWPREKLLNLKYSLEKLINPFTQEGEEQIFAINLYCEREEARDVEEEHARSKVNGAVANFIFETLNVKTTWISTVFKKGLIDTRLVDRGTEIYHIEEANADYSLIEDAHYQLFFLNQAAKNNFTRLMGIPPVTFGSVFLFKNGFRVYPFGDPGDDSLGMDYRKQQGYARFLGTRDLLGRIELFTTNDTEFKEVTSRDGGLVETVGYRQVIDSIYEKCLKRLERYVVDVQWAYTKDENLKNDKLSEDISIVQASIIGRVQIADVLRKLSASKNIKILSYNKDLVNILNEKLDIIPPEVFKDLAKIADKTGDKAFKEEITRAEERYHKLLQEKAEAERRAAEEEEKRQKAEEQTRLAEEARARAEERARVAEEAKHKAELAAKEKELQRREEEVKRKEAEQRAKEEEGKRKEAEQDLKTEKQKNRYLQSTRKTISDDAEQLVHSIKITATSMNSSLSSLKRNSKGNNALMPDIEKIQYQVSKILKISNLITKSNFRIDDEMQEADLPSYINEYVENYASGLDKVKINVDIRDDFETKLSLLDIAIIIDNLVSNSVKSKAENILIECFVDQKSLYVDFSDDGEGIPAEYLGKKSAIFELGVTSTDGSGIGLYTIKSIMKTKKYGDIELLGNNKTRLKGAAFRLIFH
jgi:signal transduction histidine kinase